ncbi:hypothetical protein [Enterobacter phage N5822]|nr:hypothetical protein [Enterobacter phage N5822]
MQRDFRRRAKHVQPRILRAFLILRPLCVLVTIRRASQQSDARDAARLTAEGAGFSKPTCEALR